MITKTQEITSQKRFTNSAKLGYLLKIFPTIFPLIFLSNPVLHGRKVILLKTHSNASLANCLCVALKIPKMEKTIKAITQNINSEISILQATLTNMNNACNTDVILI